MTFADAKQRFSTRVADYVRYRPGYPSALLEVLRAECALRPGHVVADVGSGTGFLSELFLKNGNRVYGIEPNKEMREAGEEYLASYDGFSSIDASAEATSLGDSSVDFVTAGQSFHWFEADAARREFARILKPGGWVVIAWNDRGADEAPFPRGYENILERFGVAYKNVKDSYPEAHRIRDFLGKFSQRDLPNYQMLDWESLCGRLRSSSYTPTEGDPDFRPMMKELRKLFDAQQQQGEVRMNYVTRVYYGQLQTRA
jgi:ubiquinone/menaquinone biosynthesis C-methylase UbiE